MSSLLIGIAGGSGSGKTTLAKYVKNHFGNKRSGILLQDYYYIDQSEKFDGDGGSVNFDHPNALDFDLLAKHLKKLKHGEEIQAPIYDFVTHTRKRESLGFEAKEVVLLDGILILSQPQICELLDLSIFVDTPAQVRFERRLNRDVQERGREPEGVKKQYQLQVLPMHNEFVEPSKVNADIIVKDGESFSNYVCSEIEDRLRVH